MLCESVREVIGGLIDVKVCSRTLLKGPLMQCTTNQNRTGGIYLY